MSRQVMTLTVTGLKEFDNALKMMGDNKISGKIARDAMQKEAITTIRPSVRKHVRSVFHGKRNLASSYSAKARGGPTLGAVRMDVYSRLNMSEPFEFSGLISAKKHEYLAIPTSFAEKIRFSSSKGLRKRSSRAKLRTKHLNRDYTFVVDTPRGKVIMMKVDDDKQSRTRKLQKKAFRGSGRKITEESAIPLFTLRKSVFIPQKTHVRWWVSRFVRPTGLKIANALKKEFFRIYSPTARKMMGF